MIMMRRRMEVAKKEKQKRMEVERRQKEATATMILARYPLLSLKTPHLSLDLKAQPRALHRQPSAP